MSQRCGWFLIAGALIAPGSAMADVRYTFDFSGSDLTSGQRVVVSYTAPTSTLAGAVLRGVTQSPKLNSRVHGTRHRNGVWRFNGFGDAHFSYVFTAYAGLMISHAPGIYANIPASTGFTCSGECGGRRTGRTAGTVNITIESVESSSSPRAANEVTDPAVSQLFENSRARGGGLRAADPAICDLGVLWGQPA